MRRVDAGRMVVQWLVQPVSRREAAALLAMAFGGGPILFLLRNVVGVQNAWVVYGVGSVLMAGLLVVVRRVAEGKVREEERR